MELAKSEQLNELAAALAQAEAEFEQIGKEAENPDYNSTYADLASLIRATRPALAKHGVTVIQVPRLRAQNHVEVATMILHSSGQYMACDLLMPAAQGDRFDAQTIGCAITYARRYAYQSMLNVAGEEDDDGNALVANAGRVQKPAKPGPTPIRSFKPSGDGRKINVAQAKGFWSAVKVGEKTDRQVAEFFRSIGIEHTEDMKKVDFDKAMKWAVGNEGKPQPVVAVMDKPAEDEIA